MHKSNVVMQWRKIRNGYAILGSKCKKCSEIFFPVRRECKKCHSKELDNYKFKGTGEIYACTTLFYAPSSFEKEVPYNVALIRLDEGPKIIAQIVDSDNIEIGLKVEACIRKIFVDGQNGIIHYGIKFKQAGE